MTYKCLDENDGDKDKCIAFIRNGKYCKTFWVNAILQFIESMRFSIGLNLIIFIC